MDFYIPILTIPFAVLFIGMACFILLTGRFQKSITRMGKLRLPKLSDGLYAWIVMGSTAVFQVLFFFVTQKLIAGFYADTDGIIPAIVMAIVSVLSFGAVLGVLFIGKESVKRFLKRLAVFSAALVAIEIVIFNGKSFTTAFESYVFESDRITIDTPDTAECYGSCGVLAKGNSIFIIDGIPEFTKVISIDAEQAESAMPFRASLGMKDDNFADYFQTAADKWVGGKGYPCEFTLEPYGEVKSLQLSITDVKSEITIKNITAMSCVPFRFSAIRYFVILAIFTVVTAIGDFGFARVVYNRDKFSHQFAMLIAVVAFASTTMFFYVPDQTMIEYPMKYGVASTDPYIQTFDAFRNGRVWIDIPVDENLESLENVYDSDIRGKSGFTVAWDRAYFEGKYYSYFGVAPVILFYYPMYFITGALPTLGMTNWFFATLAILFTCLAILAVVRKFVKKPNMLLLLLTLLAGTALCGGYFCLQDPNMYNVVVASGVSSLMMSIWLGVTASCTEEKLPRIIMLVFCGLALGMCAASRPSMALGGLILAPVFIAILLDKNQKISFRFTQAAAFLIPVCIIGAGLMYYNFLRFGSPFDFGASYQLTVSDVHANKLRIEGLFPAIFHYFLQPVGVSPLFPYFDAIGFFMGNYGMYGYADALVGVLQFPMIFFGLLMLPRAMRVKETGIVRFERRTFYVGCFVLAVVLAWAVFCLAGSHMRYAIDIVPLLILGCTCTLLTTAEKPSQLQYKLSIVALIVTIVFTWLLMLSERDGVLVVQNPNLFDAVEDLVVFWQ